MSTWWDRLKCRLLGHHWAGGFLVCADVEKRRIFKAQCGDCPCVRCGDTTPSRFVETPRVVVWAPKSMSDWMAVGMATGIDDDIGSERDM